MMYSRNDGGLNKNDDIIIADHDGASCTEQILMIGLVRTERLAQSI